MKNDKECYRMMQQDKFLILNGSVENIANISPQNDVQLVFYGNSYEVTWKSNQDTILRIAFPNNFELISGKNKIERDAWLEQLLRGTDPTKQYIQTARSGQASYYEIPEVSDSVYFQSTVFGRKEPIFDKQHMRESVKNLFLGAVDKKVLCIVNQKNYQQDSYYIISLAQWLTYCYNEQLHLYVGLEKETEADYTLLCVAESKELGFIHSASISVPKKIIRPSIICRVKMTLRGFIPTHNIKELY